MLVLRELFNYLKVSPRKSGGIMGIWSEGEKLIVQTFWMIDTSSYEYEDTFYSVCVVSNLGFLKIQYGRLHAPVIICFYKYAYARSTVLEF